jgi:hypothetical protein
MPDLADHLTRLFVRDLGTFRRELELFPDDETLWRVPPGVSNSGGTLTLHACGNLRHFVGAGLGETGYVRDRDAEFSRRGVSRAELLREIEQTIAEVRGALSSVDPKRFDQPWPQQVGGVTLPTGLFLIHLTTHLAFHLGQVGYLRRILTGVDQGSGAVSPAALGT